MVVFTIPLSGALGDFFTFIFVVVGIILANTLMLDYPFVMFAIIIIMFFTYIAKKLEQDKPITKEDLFYIFFFSTPGYILFGMLLYRMLNNLEKSGLDYWLNLLTFLIIYVPYFIIYIKKRRQRKKDDAKDEQILILQNEIEKLKSKDNLNQENY